MKQEAIKALLAKAPSWWDTGDKKIYDNLIFVMPPETAKTICTKIGEPSADLEQVLIVDKAIFWSFDRQRYAKARWWKKTAANGITEFLTIRTANTLKKIAAM